MLYSTNMSDTYCMPRAHPNPPSASPTHMLAFHISKAFYPHSASILRCCCLSSNGRLVLAGFRTSTPPHTPRTSFCVASNGRAVSSFHCCVALQRTAGACLLLRIASRHYVSPSVQEAGTDATHAAAQALILRDPLCFCVSAALAAHALSHHGRSETCGVWLAECFL